MANITANVVDGKLDYSYTDKKEEKKKASGADLGYDQFLQLLAAEMQYQDPLEPTSNTEYVAQLATFSQLEAMLSMQNTMTSEMANSLVGKQVILTEETSTGKTTTVTGNVDYVMYQDGKTYLSVNGSYYPLEQLDTVVDNAYYEAIEMSNTFHSMLAQLPNVNDIKGIYQGAVNDVRSFYDGMTSYQQKYVDSGDLSNLEAYEQRIRELTNAEEDATGIVENFSKTISALPSVNDVTAGDAGRIQAARNVYEDMTDGQKSQVRQEDLSVLEALETALAGLTA